MRIYRRTSIVVVATAVLALGIWSLRSLNRPAPAVAAIAPAVPSAPSAPSAPIVSGAATGAPLARQSVSSIYGPLLDLEGLPIAGFLDRMAPRARRGDADVAYRVYQAERICSEIDVERFWLRESMSMSDDARQDLERSVARRTALCLDVTPAQMQERFVFLEQAIRAGNHAAMLDYRNEGPLGFDTASLDPNDVRLIEWKQRSNGYLESLAAQGDRDAWIWLATDYESGRYVAQDYAAANRYRAALFTSGGQPDRDPMTVGYVADMARTMSPADVQTAIEQGRSLGRQFPRKQR